MLIKRLLVIVIIIYRLALESSGPVDLRQQV